MKIVEKIVGWFKSKNTNSLVNIDFHNGPISSQLGTPLEDITDVEFLRQEVKRLWITLDRIDGADNMEKFDDLAYRELVGVYLRERSQNIVSDGYHLFQNKVLS